MSQELKDDEFAIIIRPINWQEKDGSDWDGDCETALRVSEALPPFIARHVMDIATMMSTFLDVAADHPEIFALVQQRRDALLDLYEDDPNMPEDIKRPKVERDGNVYILDAWSKTEGEA